ncbi:MAG TPA: hypothetical protein VMU88_00255, partial [bacterium]|nr:hypothetical protein [bacterium]
MPLYERQSTIPGPVGQVYAWHLRPGAFRRLTPYWAGAREISSQEIRDGNRTVFSLPMGPLRVKWVAE